MLTLYLWLYLQPLIHRVLVHGFETRAPHGPEARQSPSRAHCSASKVRAQRRATPSPELIRNHSWYHLQGMLVQCGRPISIKILLWLHSLKEQQRWPQTSLLTSCSLVQPAASGRQEPHRDSVQEPGPGVGQPCFPLLHAGHRGRMRSLLETTPNSVNPEPAGEYFNFAVSVGCLPWGSSTIKWKEKRKKRKEKRKKNARYYWMKNGL